MPAQSGQPCREHAVHLYSDEAAYLDEMTSWVIEGFAAGDAVLLLMTARHLAAMEAALAERGIDVAGRRDENMLRGVDADAALPLLLEDGAFSEARAEAALEPVLTFIRAAAGRGSVRALGELVDLLWRRGDTASTLALERFWNARMCAAPWRFTCAYRVDDVPSPEAASDLRDVCALHGAVDVAALAQPRGASGALARAASAINNPLTVVKANLQLALEQLGSAAASQAELRAGLAEALEGADRIGEVVQRLRRADDDAADA